MARGFDDGRMKTGVIRSVLTATPLLMATASFAQVTPPPVVPTAPAPTPTLAPPVITVPPLSDAQAALLDRLLNGDIVAQGLKSAATASTTAPSKDELVRAALDHARAVHAGRLSEADFQRDWGLRPPAYDPTPAFADAVRLDRIAAWFASLPPPYAGYDGLRKGLQNYRSIASAGGWAPLASGPDFTIGATGPRVIALRKRLAAEDKDVATSGDRFDASGLARLAKTSVDKSRIALARAPCRYTWSPMRTYVVGSKTGPSGVPTATWAIMPASRMASTVARS